jgi:predicted DNA-binding antitoxin AbrB/MazE fold protein
MTETITALYEKGILRPLQPLQLQEGQTVRIRILPELAAADDAAVRLLVEAGLLTPPPGRSDVEPPSEQAQRELADRLGRAPGKSLSQIIIEDRGE